MFVLLCVFTHLPCRLNDLVCQLEERERNSEAVLQSSDKEATLKQQVLELHKKKVRVGGGCGCVGGKREGGRRMWVCRGKREGGRRCGYVGRRGRMGECEWYKSLLFATGIGECPESSRGSAASE